MQHQQPAAASAVPNEPAAIDRLLRLPAVSELTGLAKTQIYGVVKKKKHLQPIKCGRVTLWPESEVRTFIDHLKAERVTH